MKKAIKKLMAALLVVAMVCAMAIPAFADTESIIEHHAFSAFQIFKGHVEGNKISNATWGNNITDPDDFLAQLKNDSTLGNLFNEADDVQDVLAVISKWSNSDDNSIAFARFVCSYLYPTADADPKPVIPGHDTIPITEAGYYLIVDTTDFSSGDDYHAYNSFLLNVTKAPWNLKVTPKVEKPSVKKEVFDNQDGTSNEAGFGSSADHAINEEFQFKLTATLPASYDNDRAYDYYDKYTVTFHDTLSAGITFDRWDTVVINNGSGDITIPVDKYNSNAAGQNLTLTIDNVKTCATGLNLNNGATITVTYTAHLNDKAFVNTADGATDNKNSVYLTYSNNPKNSTFLGKTPESEVYVFTYQLNNTKYHDKAEAGNELEGAGFRLYSDEACEHEVALYKEGEFYYPIKNATGKTPVEMKSAANGQFNVKGLDAGTYYLKETTTPTNYNTCANTTIVISATHTNNNVTLSNDSNLQNSIINNGGTTLPSTGGIGTTLFYVIGGGLMVAAAVLLITKKRMENR